MIPVNCPVVFLLCTVSWLARTVSNVSTVLHRLFSSALDLYQRWAFTPFSAAGVDITKPLVGLEEWRVGRWCFVAGEGWGPVGCCMVRYNLVVSVLWRVVDLKGVPKKGDFHNMLRAMKKLLVGRKSSRKYYFWIKY